nr:MAG TPA: hypothetical protein [Caudoviricetes sp.]
MPALEAQPTKLSFLLYFSDQNRGLIMRICCKIH